MREILLKFAVCFTLIMYLKLFYENYDSLSLLFGLLLGYLYQAIDEE